MHMCCEVACGWTDMQLTAQLRLHAYLENNKMQNENKNNKQSASSVCVNVSCGINFSFSSFFVCNGVCSFNFVFCLSAN